MSAQNDSIYNLDFLRDVYLMCHPIYQQPLDCFADDISDEGSDIWCDGNCLEKNIWCDFCYETSLSTCYACEWEDSKEKFCVKCKCCKSCCGNHIDSACRED